MQLPTAYLAFTFGELDCLLVSAPSHIEGTTRFTPFVVGLVMTDHPLEVL